MKPEEVESHLRSRLPQATLAAEPGGGPKNGIASSRGMNPRTCEQAVSRMGCGQVARSSRTAEESMAPIGD